MAVLFFSLDSRALPQAFVCMTGLVLHALTDDAVKQQQFSFSFVFSALSSWDYMETDRLSEAGYSPNR